LWLEVQARSAGLAYLLAHADDGVIWGRVDEDGTLHSSHDAFPDVSPPLREGTLQQARLFGPGGELLLWRDGDDWRARLAQDAPADGEDCTYDEPQMLWGYRHIDTTDGFTLVDEGQQGLRHAPPIIAPPGAFAPNDRPLRLVVRHYLTPDRDSGLLRVWLSRLLDVTCASNGKEEQA